MFMHAAITRVKELVVCTKPLIERNNKTKNSLKFIVWRMIKIEEEHDVMKPILNGSWHSI